MLCYIILYHILVYYRPGVCEQKALWRGVRMGAVPFIPMPMPKPVCRTKLYNKIVQLEVCRTFSGRDMGINGTAQYGKIGFRTMGWIAVSAERLQGADIKGMFFHRDRCGLPRR